MATRKANNYLMDFEETGYLPADEEATSQVVVPTKVTTQTSSKTPTFADLTKAYNEKGATTRRDVMEGEEMKTYYEPTDLGGGWMAWEKPPEIIGVEGQGENAVPIYSKPELGGFSRKEGDKVNFYNLNGDVVHSQNWNESAFNMAWQDVGPVAMAALTAGGAGGALGSTLLGEGASQIASNALGGALLGGGGAALSGGNVLQGALLGGAGGALSGYMAGDTATSSNSLANVNTVELNAAYDAASNMVDSGMSAGQINEQLVSAGYDPNVINATLEDVSNLIAAKAPATQPSSEIVTQQPVSSGDVVNVTAPSAPSAPSAPTLNNVITAIASNPITQANEVVVTAKTPEQVAIDAGFPSLNVSNMFGGNIDAYNQARTMAITANRMAVNREDTDLRYDVNNDGKVTSADALMISKGTPLRQLETVEVTAPSQPAQQPTTLNNVISTIATLPETQTVVTPPAQQLPTVEVTAPAQQQQVTSQDVVNTIIANQTPELTITSESPARQETVSLPELIITGQTPFNQEELKQVTFLPDLPSLPVLPETIITGERPVTQEKPSSITEDTSPPAIIVPSSQIDTTIPTQEKKYTLAELSDLARLGLLGAGLIAGSNAASSGQTQYDIVPVPADWKSPVYQKDLPPTTPTQLTPIDFGTRNLLIGTQWEKFLDPNYGKIPAQKQFNQPSKMSYDRLMSILGTGIDVLPSRELTINDVISGIQNQYGQTP